MSQNVVATIEKTSASPLAEVTKSRTSLENTLNNNGGSVVKKVQQPKAAPKATKATKAANRGYATVKPWSTMSAEDLAEVVKKNQEEEDDEDVVMPTRRRAPPPRGASTTVTSYTSGSLTSVPTSPIRVQAPALPPHHSMCSSPVNFYAATAAPAVTTPQPRTHAVLSPPVFNFPTQPQPTIFDHSSYIQAPCHGSGAATPPSMMEPTATTATAEDENPCMVGVYRNDPYAFNVLGDNQTMEASATRTTTPPYHTTAITGSHMDTSFYSTESEASTVGYVHSADVSPVKNQQQGTLYSEQRRASVAAMAGHHQWPLINMSTSNPLMYNHQDSSSYTARAASPVAQLTPSIAIAAPQGKVKRVYVNGRPIITPQ